MKNKSLSLIRPGLDTIGEEEKGQELKGKYKRSGHLTDQILKYEYPKEATGQLSLWDRLRDHTKRDIQAIGVERTQVVEGIKLTPSETKVVDCLSKMLHERSQTLEPTDEDYYTGNSDPELVEYVGETTPAPKLAFTLYDLTKEYVGVEKRVAGKDMKNVANILETLSQKQFLLRYKEETYKAGGSRTVKEVEVFERIITLPKLRITEFDEEGIEISKEEELLVVLHPIFRRQIENKFILYPNDINKRTIIAYGSNNVSQITLRLRDYLMRELSSKHYQPEIGLNRLYYLVAEKWMSQSRKKKVREYTEKAIDTMITLGLLKSYEIRTAKTSGEPKIVFTLNKDFE